MTIKLPQASALESLLAKSCTCMLGRDLEQIRSEKRNEIIGQNQIKTWKNCPIHRFNHPFTALPIRQDALSLHVCISALLLSYLNQLFLCVLSHTLYCVSNDKLHTYFYSSCLLEKFTFQTRQEPGELCF